MLSDQRQNRSRLTYKQRLRPENRFERFYYLSLSFSLSIYLSLCSKYTSVQFYLFIFVLFCNGFVKFHFYLWTVLFHHTDTPDASPADFTSNISTQLIRSTHTVKYWNFQQNAKTKKPHNKTSRAEEATAAAAVIITVIGRWEMIRKITFPAPVKTACKWRRAVFISFLTPLSVGSSSS